MSTETDTKKWYQSRGIWGGIVGILAAIAGALGYAVGPEDQEALLMAIMGIGSALGGIIAVWGRAKASKSIGK